MRTKLLSVLAIALLVAACSTTPESQGTAEGTGSSSQAASSSGGSAPVSSTATPSTQSQALAPDSQEYLVVNVGDRVFFDFDKSEIRSDAAATLKRQAAWMEDNPNVTVIIEGHCDERGTREYNLALGERRANAVREHLISLGVSAARIETISYGKERPAVTGSNEAAWAQNRRAVMVKKGAGS
jgi:peptidoglycan-associated lipoprotein